VCPTAVEVVRGRVRQQRGIVRAAILLGEERPLEVAAEHRRIGADQLGDLCEAGEQGRGTVAHERQHRAGGAVRPVRGE
jgi:hypothetical protein